MNKKKILFVTTRSPFSNIFAGDRQRARLIIDQLSKKNKLDVLYSDQFKGNIEIKNTEKIFYKTNLFDRFKRILNSLFKFEPLQLGYFYSRDVEYFLKENHEKYHTIIFHLIRSAQYLPKEFIGKRILEMTDLMSKNYNQTAKSFSIFNPLKYLYFLEKILVKKYEGYCEDYFDKIVLSSKNDLKNSNIKNLKKYIEIPNTVEIKKNIFNYKKTNKKILFIGNLNYLPNKEACKNFAKKILPQLNKINTNFEFHIIGEINKIDKIIFNSIKKTFAHGAIKNINHIVKDSICGICNVEIATGTQMKILTYMSYGLPCVASSLSFKNTLFSKNKEILVYKNNNEFIKIIKKLKGDKKFSQKLSKKSYSIFNKKYNKSKIFSDYEKII